MDITKKYLDNAGGDRIVAACYFSKGLMEGNPAEHKVGYSEVNAVATAREAFDLREYELLEVMRRVARGEERDKAFRISMLWQHSMLGHARQMIEEVYNDTESSFAVEDPCETARAALEEAQEAIDSHLGQCTIVKDCDDLGDGLWTCIRCGREFRTEPRPHERGDCAVSIAAGTVSVDQQRGAEDE